MVVSWEKAECFDERPGKRMAAAAASSAALEMARAGHSPGAMRAGRASETARRQQLTRLPDQGDVLRMAAFLEGHPGWSAFWDKRDGCGGQPKTIRPQSCTPRTRTPTG
jgi:hypothetical protein